MENKKAQDAGSPSVCKVAIYIRVSTVYQVDKDSLPMQRRDLIAYSELLLGISDYEIFEDAGYSGKNTYRPAYQEMMARIEKNEFSHLLVWKIDRISRNLSDFSDMYETLRRLRVTFVSKNEQFDTSTAMGEAMLKIILVFAELERNMTSERVTATMISRATQGLWNGGKVPFGYSYDKEKKVFLINEEEAAVCRVIRDSYLKSKSLVQTSRLLNSYGYKTRNGKEWSPVTCWKIVSSPFYAGIYRYNHYKGVENRTINPQNEWVLVPNHHPAIFTVEEHEAMASILEKNSKFMRSAGKYVYKNNVYVFSGLCYCGSCGARLTPSNSRKQADGYQTVAYSCPNRRRTKECSNPTVNDLIIGEFVLNYILNILRAKRQFLTVKSPSDFERILLSGSAFSSVKSVDASGLNELYNLLASFPNDASFSFSEKKTRKRKAVVDPEIAVLKKEKDRQERALRRLANLYLYAEKSMSEQDYMARSAEISARIEEVNKKLGMLTTPAESSLSDEDFIRQASHLLISSRLKGKEYIYYKSLAESTSPEVLRDYFASIIDNITLLGGKVVSIVFKNGLTHKFEYK